MSEFDDLIKSIRKAARQMAEYRLLRAEQSGEVSVGFYRDFPKFSETQRNQLIIEFEDEAVRRIYAHLHDIAIKSQCASS